MIKIVGAGITGLTIARILAEQGEKVIIYDNNYCVGGLLKDYLYYNYYISDSGVHIFHTDNKKVKDFICKFGDFVAYNHIVSADVYGTDFAINFPASKNNRLSKEKIKNLYKFYSLKQWGFMPNKEVLNRCKTRDNNSLYFFNNKYVAIPFLGWTTVCENIIKHKNIQVILNKQFTLNDIDKNDKVYFTGRLDILFDYKYGEIKYRSINIVNKLEGDDFANVMNKSLPNCDYTRIINWRRCSSLLSDKQNLYGYEFPRNSEKNELAPHYIIEGQNEIYNKYKTLALEKNIIPCGRIGGNKYINIDEAILYAMNLVEKDK